MSWIRRMLPCKAGGTAGAAVSRLCGAAGQRAGNVGMSRIPNAGGDEHQTVGRRNRQAQAEPALLFP
jgi:hypothetical protein